MTYWFIFCKTDLLLQKQADGSYTIPCSEESPIALKPWTHVLNISPMEDGTEVKAFTINTPVTNNPNYEMCGLRPSYYKLSRDLYLKAGKCHELIYWDQNTQFCGICGAPMKMSTDISKNALNAASRYGPRSPLPSSSSYAGERKSFWYMPATSRATSMDLWLALSRQAKPLSKPYTVK